MALCSFDKKGWWRNGADALYETISQNWRLSFSSMLPFLNSLKPLNAFHNILNSLSKQKEFTFSFRLTTNTGEGDSHWCQHHESRTAEQLGQDTRGIRMEGKWWGYRGGRRGGGGSESHGSPQSHSPPSCLTRSQGWQHTAPEERKILIPMTWLFHLRRIVVCRNTFLIK